MAFVVSPVLTGQQFNSSGLPLSGGKIFVYEGGSFSSLSAAYSDASGAVQNANPMVLNSAGWLTTGFFLETVLTYNIVLTKADGTTVLATFDDITVTA